MKRVGAIGAGGVATTGVASGAAARAEVREADVSVETVRAELAADATDALSLLASEGVLSAASLSAVPSRRLSLTAALAGENEGFAAGTIEGPDGQSVQSLAVAVVETDAGLVRAVLDRDTGVAYGVVGSGKRVEIHDPTADGPVLHGDRDTGSGGGCTSYCSRTDCYFGFHYRYRQEYIGGQCSTVDALCGC